MKNEIIVFNIIFYAVTIGCIRAGSTDPSSSLGYGFFILFFWIISTVVLIILWSRKIIQAKSLPDKIGMFTATPIISICTIGLIFLFQQNVHSETYFTENNYRYKVREVSNNYSANRWIEYYKTKNTIDSPDNLPLEVWVKDSTWVYLSETKDTLKKIQYKNGVKIN